MITLSKEQVVRLHERMIYDTGGLNGIRDEDLLESALASPFQTFEGNELYPSTLEKIARIVFCLIDSRPKKQKPALRQRLKRSVGKLTQSCRTHARKSSFPPRRSWKGLTRAVWTEARKSGWTGLKGVCLTKTGYAAIGTSTSM